MADQSTPPGDVTLPSRKRMLQAVTRFGDDAEPNPALPAALPWALQLYFDGEIDLNKVLAGHFPQVPVMSTIHVGEIGRKNRIAVAALSTQDGAASLIAEVDVLSLAVQFTFVQGSMLAQRFTPEMLTEADRAQWIATLHREFRRGRFPLGSSSLGARLLDRGGEQNVHQRVRLLAASRRSGGAAHARRGAQAGRLAGEVLG